MEYLAQNLESESWSVAVEQNYLKSLSKEAVKRQEVIYGKRLSGGRSGNVMKLALLLVGVGSLIFPLCLCLSIFFLRLLREREADHSCSCLCFLEFIQTEMHHVRTLKILLQVYMYELRRSQLMEDAKLDRLFVSVEELLSLHQHFLSCLKARQKDAQAEEGPNNYQITQFGDVLVSQVGKHANDDGDELIFICSRMFMGGNFQKTPFLLVPF